MITKTTSVLSSRGEATVRTYRENGKVIAQGEGYLRAYEDYLTNTLGYDLSDLDAYIWKDVVGYSNYEICELGLVRTKDKGNIVALNPKEADDGNNKASWRVKVLMLDGDKRGVEPLHKVMLLAFKGECPEYIKDADGKHVVSHENDRPFDNRLYNLRYRTQQENKDIEGLNYDLINNGLTVHQVVSVYNEINDALLDTGWTIALLPELPRNVLNRVKRRTGMRKGTIKGIYDLRGHGWGIMARLMVDEEGNYYNPYDVPVK